MKKGFSLVEVLVSVALISVVISAVLQMQQNNLNFLERFNDTLKTNSLFNLGISNFEDGKHYFKDLIDFQDDDIRQQIKEFKIEKKTQTLDAIPLPENEYIKNATVEQILYTIDDKTRVFYKFKLQ
ncbi:MAG: prepilin-type N-terminal cleavage/methylation domain-containing protein [Campylobacterales bacterium]|nr:prepilin-type N-terminal cleavage/methylation domain-containing protein [Campylobacterales bacterium]